MTHEELMLIVLQVVWENNFEWDTQKLFHLLPFQVNAINIRIVHFTEVENKMDKDYVVTQSRKAVLSVLN